MNLTNATSNFINSTAKEREETIKNATLQKIFEEISRNISSSVSSQSGFQTPDWFYYCVGVIVVAVLVLTIALAITNYLKRAKSNKKKGKVFNFDEERIYEKDMGPIEVVFGPLVLDESITNYSYSAVPTKELIPSENSSYQERYISRFATESRKRSFEKPEKGQVKKVSFYQ